MGVINKLECGEKHRGRALGEEEREGVMKEGMCARKMNDVHRVEYVILCVVDEGG